jgi:AbrB family looped-hinge helix DNA binding protein
MTLQRSMAMEHKMSRQAIKVGPGGRIVIPLSLREKLAIHPGDTIWLETDGDNVRITSIPQAIRQAKDLVARHVHPDRNLADELIAERRKDASYE